MLSINHYWRITAAGISYVVFALGAVLPGIYMFCLAAFPMDAEAKQRKTRKVIQQLCRFYVNFMQALGLMKYELLRQHHDAVKGHVVISNHSMLIDALFVLAYVDNLCCVVKSDLCLNPFTRVPVRLAGYIANNDEQLVDRAKRKLDAGENVLIFPEGTRNHHHLQLEFKRGAANIAVVSQAPLMPLIICCVPRALQKGEKWYQLPNKKSRIHVELMKPLRIADCIDTSRPRTVQYRHLTDYLRGFYAKKIRTVVDSLEET